LHRCAIPAIPLTESFSIRRSTYSGKPEMPPLEVSTKRIRWYQSGIVHTSGERAIGILFNVESVCRCISDVDEEVASNPAAYVDRMPYS
jgi:hypothetical protein